jgi:hypothetical protein
MRPIDETYGNRFPRDASLAMLTPSSANRLLARHLEIALIISGGRLAKIALIIGVTGQVGHSATNSRLVANLGVTDASVRQRSSLSVR